LKFLFAQINSLKELFVLLLFSFKNFYYYVFFCIENYQ
jgi:hypothetical protein